MRSLLKVQWMYDPHELWNVQNLSQSGESNTARTRCTLGLVNRKILCMGIVAVVTAI